MHNMRPPQCLGVVMASLVPGDITLVREIAFGLVVLGGSGGEEML